MGFWRVGPVRIYFAWLSCTHHHHVMKQPQQSWYYSKVPILSSVPLRLELRLEAWCWIPVFACMSGWIWCSGFGRKENVAVIMMVQFVLTLFSARAADKFATWLHTNITFQKQIDHDSVLMMDVDKGAVASVYQWCACLSSVCVCLTCCR